MLDRFSLRLCRPLLDRAALTLHRRGIGADTVSVAAFAAGLGAAVAIAVGHYRVGLLLILLNRLGDGIDGALARLDTPTDRGAFLDITLDFLFYAAVVLGFALAVPERNATPAAVLLFSFVGTGSSFLAYAIIAERRSIVNLRLPSKGFYYLGGLAEGTETVIFFLIACLFPGWFPSLALIFAAVCLAATALRIAYGVRTLD